MADLPCPRCGEPWDNEVLHEVAEELGTTYDKAAKKFRQEGCLSFKDTSYESPDCQLDDRSVDRFAISELLGSDMDGYAAMSEDFGF